MTHKVISIVIIVCAFLFAGIDVQAQLFEKLQKKAKESAERTLERKVDEKTEEETEKAFEKVFEGEEENNENRSGNPNPNTNSKENSNTVDQPGKSGGQPKIETAGGNKDISRGSSFFPDGTIIFSDDFALDAKGDFPSKWHTNAGGEIILIDGEKALRMYPNGTYIPDMDPLPDNYALDFDLTTANLDYEGLSGSSFRIQLVDQMDLNGRADNGAELSFSLWAKSSQTGTIHVYNWGSDVMKINNRLNYQMGPYLNNTVHFTVVKNKKRMRFYVNNEKVIDIPSLLQNNAGKYIQIHVKGTSKAMDHIAAIHNFKIMEEGLDVRAMLMKGGFSTNKILFESGSDKLQASSYSILDKIGNAMVSEGNLHVMVIGHTDSDGDDAFNQTLSDKRAKAVKKYLEEKFNISPGRLMTMGKGESDPVADNASAEGKAQNRRVEFKTL